MTRYGKEKAAKVKELDLRHRTILKEGHTLPQELEEIYQYYKEM